MSWIRREPAPRFEFHAGWIFLGAALTGWLLLKTWPQVVFISCPWKQGLGYPCPTCGTTRSVLSLMQFQLLDAFRYNPLITGMILVGVGTGIAALYQAVTGQRWVLSRRPGKGVRWALLWAIIIVANEAYLILNGI